MLQLSTFLEELGFNLKVHSDASFSGNYISDDGLEINTLFFDSVIGMQVTFKDLKRTILDSTKINSVDELVFMLSRNIFIKSQFQTLHREMIQSQTLSNVKHP